jgi:hypothetical protein
MFGKFTRNTPVDSFTIVLTAPVELNVTCAGGVWGTSTAREEPRAT